MALLAVLTLWLTFNLHSRTGHLTYKSELFGDKAGYYIYLPATFIYGFDGGKVPTGLSEKTGKGFYVDSLGKICTKYPVGVALMQSPFFLATHHLIAPLLGDAADGFSMPYHRMVDVAAWAYLMLGLLILARVLGEYFKPPIVWATLLCFLLGTNLFYYYAVESGMSHVYSFFLVAALIRLTQKIHRRGVLSWGLGLLLGLVCGLLIVTRFTNAMVLSVLLFWDAGTLRELKGRVRLFLRSPGSLAIPVIPLVLASLQMCYYQYLTGDPFLYSYPNESFDFAHPELLRIWLSPHNGLFPYAPTMVFALVGLGRMVHQRLAGGWYGIVLFLATSYVFASWWQWFFGCSFGSRPFVEYFPVFMLPFGHFLVWVSTQSRPLKFSIYGLLGLLAIVNVKTSYLYVLVFLGENDWDWGYWWRMETAF
jgi:hypothetical protein